VNLCCLPHLKKPELQGSDGPAIKVSGAKVISQKPEIDTKTVTSTTVFSKDPNPPELGGSQTGTESRHELDSPATGTITNIAELSSDPYRYELDGGEGVRWKTRDV
jgi:hypothetical protein